MKKGRTPFALLCLLLLLPAAGCGGTKEKAAKRAAPSPGGATLPRSFTPARTNPAATHQATIGVFSSARQGNLVIKPRYTCYGQNISPPLEWVGVPPSSAELLLLARIIWHGKVTTPWAVAGISPKETAVGEGQLPKGAILGRNSLGELRYNLCPPPGVPALITFGIYALPHPLHLAPGFSPESLLHVLTAPGVQWGGLVLLAAERTR